MAQKKNKNKHKGASQPLPYSQRLQQQMSAQIRAERARATEQSVELVYLVDAIAMNMVFGFGEKRIKAYQAKAQELMAYAKELTISDGFEYAHSVLQRRYHQTVKQVVEE